MNRNAQRERAITINVAAPTAPSATRTHAEVRRDLWVAVAVAVAQSSNATEKDSMWSWADVALKAFDERFKA